MCQSVTGPLMRWNNRDWKNATKWITKNDGSKFTPEELKKAFMDELAKGHEVIPMGKVCDGFDYKTGCPGHDVAEEIATTSPEHETP